MDEDRLHDSYTTRHTNAAKQREKISEYRPNDANPDIRFIC